MGVWQEKSILATELLFDVAAEPGETILAVPTLCTLFCRPSPELLNTLGATVLSQGSEKRSREMENLMKPFHAKRWLFHKALSVDIETSQIFQLQLLLFSVVWYCTVC